MMPPGRYNVLVAIRESRRGVDAAGNVIVPHMGVVASSRVLTVR